MNMIDYPNIFTIDQIKVKERKDMDVNGSIVKMLG
jgi:hypothetical protein